MHCNTRTVAHNLCRPHRHCCVWLLACVLQLWTTQPLWADALRPGEPPPAPVDNSEGSTTAAISSRNGLTVNPQKRAEARQFFQTNYVAVDSAAHNWNGDQANCNAGETTPEFRAAIALRINYYRAMAGVPADIQLHDEYNTKAQQAALMMSANGQLNHTPPAEWVCYNADGATAAGKSNLHLVFGPAAIDGYMEDPGNGNDLVGHRRWLLYPQTQQMGTGDIPPVSGYPAANALWVFDSNLWGPRPATREEFVAWPPPGYVPHQVVYPRWSFAYPAADFTNATVTMSQQGNTIPVVMAPVQDGYGENTLVWTPSISVGSQRLARPAADTVYEVTISNVQIQGVARTFSYTVTIFDPATGDPAATKALFLPLIRR